MKPFYFLPFLPVFPYTRFFIRVFFCRSERRKKRKFRRFFSFELNVRFPLQFGSYIFTPPRHDSGSAWSRTRKGLTKIVKPFSYAAFCSRRLISFVLGVRNNVAFRCATLHQRRARSDASLRFRRKHTLFRSTTNNRRTNSFELFAQPTVAKIATQGWLQCTTFFCYNYLKQIKELLS